MTVPAQTTPRSPQIRPRLRVALDALVSQGLTIAEAAQVSEMTYESLRVALHRPHVQSEITRLKRERLGLESLRSFHKVVKLRDNAESDRVRLDACKVILTSAGDLEPERQSSPSSGAFLQIIVNAARAPAVAQPPANGVYELPPYTPGAGRALIEHPPLIAADDEDDDEPED